MDDDDRLAAVGALGDRLRRTLYRFVAGAHRAVSRSEAAEATGVTRAAAAFHLDRLVADGLLDAEFRRLGGRQGPGAGRPTKLYRRAAGDVAVSLPPRRYDLAADLLAAAVDESTRTGEPVGVDPGPGRPRPGGDPRRGRRRLVDRRPRSTSWPTTATSPSSTATRWPWPTARSTPWWASTGTLVCGMNLALLEGFAAGLPGHPFTARLQPDDQHCCVRLDRRRRPPRRRRP